MKSKLRTLSIFIALLSIYFGFVYIYNFSIVTFLKSILFNDSVSENVKSLTIFTKDELKQYNGNDKKDLYLSILGNVYDVTKASKHYGPGQSYHIFVGKDASKSFITGNFNNNDEHVSDDISDLKPHELVSLKDWKTFYDKEYIKKGVLIGRYFDVNGNPTEYSKIIDKLIKNAENINKEKQIDDQKYPPCNIEWMPESGTKVWCTKQSGGINRNWIGVPRKYYAAGASQYRCACVENRDDPNLRQFENCDPDAVSCYIETD